MEISIWISIFMALIAFASAAITFALFRSSTDPEVIVYIQPDHRRPSVVNLIIKNIGNGPACNIQFFPSRSLPQRAWGVDVPDEIPNEMDDGPIIHGVPYLAPGQLIVMTLGQYGGLYKFIGNTPINLKTKYRRANKKLFLNKTLSSESIIDIQPFKYSDVSDHNWGKKISENLMNTNKELSKIHKSISEIFEENKNQM